MRLFLMLVVVTMLFGCAGNFYCTYESRSEMIEEIVKEVRDGEKAQENE